MSAAGMSEDAYRHITYDLTLSVARTMLRVSPKVAFVYVSGLGTDSTEKGSAMWARVKGKTENDLLALGFDRAYMFRPAHVTDTELIGRAMLNATRSKVPSRVLSSPDIDALGRSSVTG